MFRFIDLRTLSPDGEKHFAGYPEVQSSHVKAPPAISVIVTIPAPGHNAVEAEGRATGHSRCVCSDYAGLANFGTSLLLEEISIIAN